MANLELYNKLTGELQTVKCWPTATPHFVVTQPLLSAESEINPDELFNVTHRNSTALALGPFRNFRLALLCAAVMGYLPVPWDDFSMAVSDQYKEPDPKQAERFKSAWNALPKEIHAWRREIADRCMFGEA